MTSSEREQMAALIRNDLPEISAVEDMIAHDVKVLEPFIDGLVKQAENRGRLAALLEKISYFSVEHSHGCMVCGDAVQCWCPFPDEAGGVTCNRHEDYVPF